MQYFHNLDLKNKILCIIIMMGVFMACVGGTGGYFSKELAQRMNSMYQDRLLPIQWLNEARVVNRAGEAYMLTMLNDKTEPAVAAAQLPEIERTSKESSALITKYEGTSLDSFEEKNLPEYKKEMDLYEKERKSAIALYNNGKIQDAYSYYMKTALPHMSNANKLLSDLSAFNAKKADETSERSQRYAAYVNEAIIGSTIFFLLISVCVGLWLAKIIARRLHNLVLSLKAVATGDLTEQIDVMAKDEIGDLGKALNATTEHLRKLVEKISQSSMDVSASSEELSSSAQQSAQATAQIAATMEKLAVSSDQQVDKIHDTTAAIEQMSGGIQEIDANITVVAAAADRTTKAAHKGEDAVGIAVQQMQKIETEVANSSLVIGKLGDRSNEIGKIVDTISAIANQTNLLALNAAIEAARAGENGKGFSVVAEEVRKLAEQSQEATAHIATLITDIQADTKNAVVAMQSGSEEVQRGNQTVKDAGETFVEIVSQIDMVSTQVQRISSAVKQIAGNSEKVVLSVEKVDEISRSSGAHMQEVSSAGEEQSAAAEEVAAACESLTRMAQDLQNTTLEFKL